MSSTRTAVTIGNFDGVHLGHQALLTRAHAVADGGRVVAVTFDPHPASVLRPDAAPTQIEPFETRAERLREAGADDVVALDPRSGILERTPDEFVEQIVAELSPGVFVEGHDFLFGKSRAGTAQMLESLANARGIQTEIVGSVNAVLTNQHVVEVSSSLVRWCINHGRVRDAAYLLGRPHELIGTAVEGDQLGRTMGFPTINLDTPCLKPQPGVYAGTATVGDDRMLAAINVGVRPSVSNDSGLRTEAHLLNDDGTSWIPDPEHPEYGFDVTLQLIAWVRDEIRFSGIDALKEQISRDTQQVIRTLAPRPV